MSREDYHDALYRECIPSRPTPPDRFACFDGPTAQWALHEMELAEAPALGAVDAA